MNRKNWMGFFMGMVAWILMTPFVRADVKVANISVKPRYPWNGLVDITYYVACNALNEKGQPYDIHVDFMGYDAVLKRDIPMTSLTGDGVDSSVKLDGPNTVTWDARKDYSTLNSSAFQVRIHACIGLYMVVELTENANATSYRIRYTDTEPDLEEDTCRTTEIWLRRIPAGTFIMGEGDSEHAVTLTHPFYMGVFECTQRQWELVMGDNPSSYKGNNRPVEQISYNMIRGSLETGGAGWPSKGHAVDGMSFLGKLRAKTGLTFDLPTEAQWEYACRAGTNTAFNSGGVGRCGDNKSDNKGGYSDYHTKVGSYPGNDWGLYDMHGNVWEWCLDWYGNYGTAAEEDPSGPNSGSYRVLRSGGWVFNASYCRSASRNNAAPSSTRYSYNYGGTNYGWYNGTYGFRVSCCLLGQ